jgi:hypothetical protein
MDPLTFVKDLADISIDVNEGCSFWSQLLRQIMPVVKIATGHWQMRTPQHYDPGPARKAARQPAKWSPEISFYLTRSSRASIASFLSLNILSYCFTFFLMFQSDNRREQLSMMRISAYWGHLQPSCHGTPLARLFLLRQGLCYLEVWARTSAVSIRRWMVEGIGWILESVSQLAANNPKRS